MTSAAQVLETIDPATGEVIAEVPDASAADVDAAVARARDAFDPGGAWRSLAPAARAQLLWKIADLIDANGDELAELETRDQGQPIGISRNISVPAAAEHFRYYAGWVTKIAGETNPLSFPQTFNYTLREPVGVCGLIIPWNFPLMITAWKVAPALACGNTCVVKPAEQTPLSALRLAELIAEAGIPDGVVRGRHRRACRGCRHRRAPRRRQGLVHRLDRGRTLGHQSVRRQSQASLSRAGRQEPGHRLRRRPARSCGRRGAPGRAVEQRAGLRGVQPRLCAAPYCRRVRRCSGLCGIRDDRRPRPRRGDAARAARHARASRERRALHPPRRG